MPATSAEAVVEDLTRRTVGTNLVVHVSLPVTTPPDRPFAGAQVALLGKPGVLSKRDVRALIEQLGGTFSPAVTPRTSIVIVGAETKAGRDAAVGTPEVPAQVARVLSEEDLCREAGLPALDTLRAHYFSARDLRGMYPVLREDHLRYLEKWGLVRPVAGRYSFSDLHAVKQVAAELERGATLTSVLRELTSAREGQLAFDFQPTHPERVPARVVALQAPVASETSLFPPSRPEQIAQANHMLAAKYFLEGAQLDDGEDRDLESAASAYRRALLFDPQLVPALVNLANIHYERDETVEAEALYEKAIRVDPECFEAYFNVGNIQHDLARYTEAVTAYRDALAINPAYPEAHFYLAVTLEKLGRSSEARPHWKEYRTLAPEGEFVELAKEFSD